MLSEVALCTVAGVRPKLQCRSRLWQRAPPAGLRPRRSRAGCPYVCPRPEESLGQRTPGLALWLFLAQQRKGQSRRLLDIRSVSGCPSTSDIRLIFWHGSEGHQLPHEDFRQTSLIDFRNPAVKRSPLIRNRGSKECAYSSRLLHSSPPSRSQDASKVRKALRDQLELQGRRDPKAIKAWWDQLGRRDRPVPRV
jgi:hypothetical protein